MEIVKGPNNSREEILAQMVAQYEMPLLRTCYMVLHDRGLAEDAAQETFLKAYKALPTFRGECSEKTWLMRIAMNTCRDMRRGAWFRWVDRSVEVDRLPEPAKEAEFMEADGLTQAIPRLPQKSKEVILLYYYQDMTLREIASVLDIAVSTAGKRVNSACRRLQKMMEKGDYYE